MSRYPHQLTIQQIVEMQDAPDNTHLYLLQQGLFYHAFNQSAVFFQGITGYKVRFMPWRGTYVEQLGIPCNVLEGALHRLQQQHPEAIIEGTFYAPHLTIELPREVVQNIPYETFTSRTNTTVDISKTVCDTLLTLNADSTPDVQLRNTIRHLQKLLRYKA